MATHEQIEVWLSAVERELGLHGTVESNQGLDAVAQLTDLVADQVGHEMAGRTAFLIGAAAGREARMDRAFPGLDVLVFGHSHIPWDSTTPAGLRLLNPGSPTDRRRQPHCNYLTAVADGGRLTDVELVRLPPR